MTTVNQDLKLPLASTTVTGTNISIVNNVVEVLADGGTVNIAPIAPSAGELFQSFSPEIMYQPVPHLPQTGSAVGNVVLSAATGGSIITNKYPSVDVDIAGTLQTLVLGTDANVEVVSNTTLVTNGSIVPDSISGMGCIQIGNYIYLIGGANSVNGYTGQTSGGRGTVYSSLINSDGSLNGWVDNANPLPQAVSSMLLLRVGNYLYSIGGSTTTGIINNVYYCQINTDNTLGPWSDTGVDMPVRGGQATGFAYNNYIYVLSSWPDGMSGTTTQAYYSTVSSTGVLGGWLDLPYNLPTYLFGGSVIRLGLNIYVIGGMDNYETNTFQNLIYSMSINPDGTLTNPTIITNPLPYGVNNQGYAIIGNTAYIIGGADGNTYATTASVMQSTITNDTFGPWTVSSLSLPSPLSSMGIINTGTNLYVIGGSNSTSSVSSVYQAPIVNNVIGTWLSTNIDKNTNLPLASTFSAFIEIDSNLYFFGGVDPSGLISSIYYAPIATDGTLGSWQLSTVSLPAPSLLLPLVVVGNTLYILGGAINGLASDTIYTSTINSSGLLSDFVLSSQKLPIPICGTQPYINNSYIYLLGGNTVNGPLDTVYYAPISNGTIGSWSLSTLVLPVPTMFVSCAVIGNTLFISGNNLTTLVQCAVDSSGIITNISATTPIIPSTVSAPFLIASGDYLYYIGGNNSSNSNYNIYQASFVNNVLSAWDTIPTYTAVGLSGMGVIMVSNILYILGGQDSNNTYHTTIWSYDINTVSTYNLIPTTAFASIPKAVYLTANTNGIGLLGDTTNGGTLANLQVSSRAYNSGTYTYSYTPLATSSSGNNAYLGMSNLNKGDKISSFSGTILGTITTTA
jgi:hypothetical protein